MHRISPTAFKTDGPRLQRIIDAAVEVFAAHGYSAATLEQIASRVNILKGSLYYYITGKSDLLFHLLTAVNEDVLEIIEAIEAEDLSTAEELRRFTREHSTYNAANAVRVSIYYRSWFQLEGERRPVFRAQRDWIMEWVRSRIVELRDAGRIHADADPETAAYHYFGSSNWIHAWYTPAHGWTPEQVGADCSRNWQRSVGLSLED